MEKINRVGRLKRCLLQRSLRKRKIAAHIWLRLEKQMPLLSRYNKHGKQQLRILASRILAKKYFTGVQGMQITPLVEATLATQIAITVFGLQDPLQDRALSWLDNWHEVVVYPTPFIRSHCSSIQMGGSPVGIDSMHDLIEEGETFYQGPLVINWQADEPHELTKQANQVLIHELAHKLDMLDGSSNGHPPLHAEMNEEKWFKAFKDAFEHINRQVNKGCKAPVNAYAATNPAEFFAVVSEYFFESPNVLRHAYPDVFEQLCLFYRQDFSHG